MSSACLRCSSSRCCWSVGISGSPDRSPSIRACRPSANCWAPSMSASKRVVWPSVLHSGGKAYSGPSLLGSGGLPCSYSIWPSRHTTANMARSSAASCMVDSAARRWGTAMATTAANADTGTINTTHRLIAPPDSSPRRAAPRAPSPAPGAARGPANPEAPPRRISQGTLRDRDPSRPPQSLRSSPTGSPAGSSRPRRHCPL